MSSMNMVSFVAFFVFALSVSLVSCGCDYNITSIDGLATVLTNDQTGWTTVPTLCFAPGTYTFASEFFLTADQIWDGPQKGVDPTCGRLISPPCERYLSASSQNATVEAIFVNAYYVIYSTTVPNLNFTMDGFSFFGSGFYLVSQAAGLGFSVTMNNSYVYQILTNVDYVTFDRSYFGWSSESADETVANGVLSSTITNSFFYQVAANSAGTITAIGNTFTFVPTVAQVTAPSYFENNAFYIISNSVVQDQYGQTTFKNNLFWITGSIYAPTVESSLNFDSNCFIDIEFDNPALWFLYDFNTTNAVFNNNYFGTPYGPQIKYSSPSPTTIGNKFGTLIEVQDYSNFNFSSYATKPLHFQAPNICPRSPFSLTVKPDNIKLGETVNITLSFSLDPLIAGAGVTPSMFDGIILQLLLYVADPTSTTSQNLGAFAGDSFQTTLNPSTQSSMTVLYTFRSNDLQYDSSSKTPSPPNYFVYYSVAQSDYTPLQYLYKTAYYEPITITPKVPLSCYNMSLSINKNVAAGSVSYSFQQLGCDDNDWQIIGGDTTELLDFTYETLLLTMGTNTSGLRLAHYQVSFVNSYAFGPSNLAHNVVTKFTIVNHNPVIHNATFTWTYPRTTQTFPNWNLLSNCSDQDGDTITVVQIQRTQARTAATVVQLGDLTLYFVTEKVVLSVLPMGQITLTAPSNSNPVTAGSPLALFWKQDISFQFQITDGDVVDQYAWGIANINYVLNE